MVRPAHFLSLRPTRQEWQGLKIQMLAIFVVSTLLNIGYYGQREWRRVADEHHLQTLLRGWDGFAWYVWLAAAPALFLLVRRSPLVPGQVARSARRLALGSCVLYLFVTNLRYAIRIFSGFRWTPEISTQSDWATYVHTTVYLLPMDFFTLVGFIAVSLAVDYYLRYRQRAEEALRLEVQTAQLQSDLARAELTALRGQLHPHFLFNSFNAVAMLVRQRRNDAAVDVISQLSGLLRLAIDRTGVQEVRLGEEIDFIRRYLEIEQVRFGEKLRVGFEIGADAIEALVPNLVLQPLVENAVKHGVSRSVDPARVQISATCSEGRLRIEVFNDGPSEPVQSLGRSRGIGLKNTRARLERLFGEDYRLELLPGEAGGMRVCLDLPLRRAPSEPATV